MAFCGKNWRKVAYYFVTESDLKLIDSVGLGLKVYFFIFFSYVCNIGSWTPITHFVANYESLCKRRLFFFPGTSKKTLHWNTLQNFPLIGLFSHVSLSL